MKKLMIAVLVAAALSGCNTIKSVTGQSEEKPKPVVSEFLGGNIKVTYKSNGEFDSMTSSHTIKLTGGLPSSLKLIWNLKSLPKQFSTTCKSLPLRTRKKLPMQLTQKLLVSCNQVSNKNLLQC